MRFCNGDIVQIQGIGINWTIVGEKEWPEAYAKHRPADDIAYDMMSSDGHPGWEFGTFLRLVSPAPAPKYSKEQILEMFVR